MKQHFLINKHSGGDFLFHFKKNADDVLWWAGPHETSFGARDIDKEGFCKTYWSK